MTDAERRDAVALVQSILIFLAPFLIILSLPFGILFASGELLPVDKILEKQQSASSEMLVSLAYSDPTRYYKLHRTREEKPKILALGNSRVMQFRSQFFADPELFYNAGGGISHITHLRQFLSEIPEAESPGIIILGLDQRYFHHEWNRTNSENIRDAWNNPPEPASVFLNSWPAVYQDLWQGKISFDALTASASNRRIGLNAVMNDMGFRKDGSLRAAEILHPLTESEKYAPFFADIDVGHGNTFPSGREVSVEALKEVELFLQDCRDRNIHVVAFLPPYAPAVHEKLATPKENYQYLFNISAKAKPLFDRHQFGFYDFSHASFIDSSDAEMLDGHHGSEKTYAKLFLRMLADRKLEERANIELLKSALVTSDSDYEVFFE